MFYLLLFLFVPPPRLSTEEIETIINKQNHLHIRKNTNVNLKYKIFENWYLNPGIGTFAIEMNYFDWFHLYTMLGLEYKRFMFRVGIKKNK